ncbi:MAG: IS1182 family transposase [Spirochaetia bacterium]|nr:IS1182 family transposase [Spirochaetia bacterium]
MNRLKGCDREQTILFSKSLADHLGEKHEIHSFIRLIDELSIRAFLERYSSEGGKAYNPRIILSILIYGFHRGWHSSRDLQKACEENAAMRYLVGAHQVKFRAIAEFRVKFHNEIDGAFSQSVSLLKSRKKTVGIDVKIDGTKIKSSAADDQTYLKSDLQARKRDLEKEISEYLRRGIELDKEEDALYGDDNSGYEIEPEEADRIISDFVAAQKARQKEERKKAPVLPRELEPKKEPKPVDPDQQTMFSKALKYEKIKTALEKNSDLPETAKINITDPDSRFMKRNGKISQSYNAQIVSSEGYIIAADIAKDNSENDLEQIPTMIDQANLNTKVKPEQVSADAGYFHATALTYLYNEKIEGFIPSPDQVSKERKDEKDSGYEAHYFKFDENEDEWICPENNRLTFQREAIRDDKKTSVYHCKPIHCVQCRVREICCSNKDDMRKGFRRLEVDEAADLKHAMIHKMQTEAAKQFYKKRGSQIESMFGIIKQSRKFREFLLRGQNKVRTQVKIAAIGFNFAKMVREGIA